LLLCSSSSIKASTCSWLLAGARCACI
jgi:hypothetical protein